MLVPARRAAKVPGSYSVYAAKAQHQIVARRAGFLVVVTSGALRWGITRETKTMIRTHDHRLHYPSVGIEGDGRRAPGVTGGALCCTSTDVGTGPPIAMWPGSGSVETTIVGTGLNNGCPAGAPGTALAFQGSTSFCVAVTVCAVMGSPTQRPDADSDWPAGHAPHTLSLCD